MYNKKLNSITNLVAKVVNGENLTAIESETVFSKIKIDEAGYYFTALSCAMHAKGETADELFGLCESNRRLGIRITPNIPDYKITDLAGTGGSRIKTINVSTAASFIVAASGVVVAKQAGFAQTSLTGSADIFREFGIEVFKLKKVEVEKTLEKIGICPFHLTPMSPELRERANIARKVFVEEGLKVSSPFHLAAFAYSPTNLKRRIYGCYSKKYLEILAKLFIKLGNERTLVIHGEGGIPEVSVVGETIIYEQFGGVLKNYKLKPKNFGLPKAKTDEIISGGRVQNVIDFLRIIYGKEKGAKVNMVIANASASLYVMGKVKNFKEGAKLSKKLLEKNFVEDKFESLVKFLGDITLLKLWKKRARIN